jgi:tetratricopeptide (TPR) repeat protein
MIAVALTAALAAGAWWWRAARGAGGASAPPEVALAGADPELAAAVEATRGRVLRKPRSAGAWGALGELLLANSFPAGTADACLARAEELDAAEPRWPYLRGWGLLPRDRDAAIAAFRRAVERTDRAPRADTSPYLLLAEVYAERDDRAQVEALCGRALEREPDNARAHFVLGMSALAHDDLDTCIPHLLRAADSPAVRQAACTQLAAAYQRQGDATRAAEFARRAQQAPHSTPWPDAYVDDVQSLTFGRETRRHHAQELATQGRLAESVDAFRRLTADDPADERAHVKLGMVLLKMGQPADAERALRTAVGLVPRSADLYYELGLALYQQGERLSGAAAAAKFRAAVDAARRAIELMPDHAAAHLSLGLSLKQLGRRAEAIASFRTALRCRPEDPEIHLALGEALADDGQRGEALLRLQRACDLAPDDPRPREALQRIRAAREEP